MKKKILIVDDKKENLVTLQRVLEEVDADIIEATNGNDALAATLLSKDESSITEVREAAEKHGAEVARDGKGRVLRNKTVENLVAHLSGSKGSGATAGPWDED